MRKGSQEDSGRARGSAQPGAHREEKTVPNWLRKCRAPEDSKQPASAGGWALPQAHGTQRLCLDLQRPCWTCASPGQSGWGQADGPGPGPPRLSDSPQPGGQEHQEEHHAPRPPPPKTYASGGSEHTTNQSLAQPHPVDAREHAGSLSAPGGPRTAAAGADRPPETLAQNPRGLSEHSTRGSAARGHRRWEDSGSLPRMQPHRRALPPPRAGPCPDAARTASGGTADS